MSSIFNRLSPNLSILLAPATPNAPAATEEGGPAAELNAELIAALPQSRLEAFLPATQDAAPELPVQSIWDTFASLSAGPWRDTLRGGRQYDGELIRHESLKKQALGGVRDAGSEVAVSPAAIALDLAQRARLAGLSDDEARWLEARLRGTHDGINQHFEADVALVKTLLETENPADAVRAFLHLTTSRGTDLDRTTPDILRALTLGVGNARTAASEGQEGILSIEAARAAQRALVHMSPADYVLVSQALALAGGTGTPAGTSQADAQTERALILKAVAAREESLRDGGAGGPYLPSSACLEITHFATLIRGVDSNVLIERTSGIDLDGDGVDEALQQRWQNASAPAVLQMARAEADPIYAWTLHEHALDATPIGMVGYEQLDMLAGAGGQALERGGEPGGSADMVLATMANRDSPQSGAAYERKTVRFDTRAAAVDAIAQNVAMGRDVPIAVTSMTGQRRAMLITDVRGSGSNQEFLVTDPWSGRTEWVSRNDFIAGNIGGNGGILSDYWL